MRSKNLFFLITLFTSLIAISSCKNDASINEPVKVEIRLLFPTGKTDTVNVNDSIRFSLVSTANLTFYKDLKKFTVNLSSTNGGQNGDIIGVQIKKSEAKTYTFDRFIKVGNIKCNQNYTFSVRDIDGEEARVSFPIVVQ